jgi:LemA protein
MKRLEYSIIGCIFLMLSMIFMQGCGVQAIPRANNNVDASFAEITNQYKRRADLIPNLVKVVKGYATHERETLTAVAEARAKATSVSIDPAHVSPAALAQFTQAQGQLSQALGRLMMVTERYPELKADVNFQALQSQLEGTENRITIARQRYIESVQEFNNLVTVPPTSFVNAFFYHFDKKPQFSLTEDESKKAEKTPEVNI